MKHLKHTLATYAFIAMSPYSLEEWSLIIAELDASMEVNGGAWRSLGAATMWATRQRGDVTQSSSIG